MSKDFDDKYKNLSAAEVIDAIGQPAKKHGDYFTISCYNVAQHHNGDKTASMAVYGYERGYYCFACGESGTNSWLLKQFGVRDETQTPLHIERVVQPTKPKNVSTPEYCDRLEALYDSLPELPEAARTHIEAKGFDADMFQSMPGMPARSGWKWHTNQVKGWGAGIFIPYMLNGRMVTARLRRLDGTPRFLSMPGNTMYPYNLDAVMHNKTVLITEGETDCLTINFLGTATPAVGIPGATSGTAIARLMEQAQNYGTRLVVIPDNDTAGEAFAQRLQLSGFEHKVAVDIYRLPFGKDVNEWYLKATHQQVESFLVRWSAATPQPMAVDWLKGINTEAKEIASWNQLATF